MKKISVLIIIFIGAMISVAHFRNKSINNLFSEIEMDEDETNGHEEREDSPEQFLKFHQAIRTRSDESKPSYAKNYQFTELEKARQHANSKSVISARTQQSNGVIAFTERGPGNVPGRTRGLIVDPDDATHKTWFCGSASGGIWKTTDAGTSWQWLTSDIPNLATTSLAMAESNHNVIYAGIGEGFGLVDGVNGNGVFKSINRGAVGSWLYLSNSVPLGDVNRIAVDPSNENNVLAATINGIFLSSDGGGNWNKVYSGVVQDLKATPGNFSIIYATENAVGVLKSVNGGSTWSKSNAGMSPTGRIEIAISPKKTNRIIASAEGSLSGVNSDLYVSDDGGASWYLVTLSLVSKTVDYLSTQGWYDNTVAFSPYDQNVVYVGGVGAYQVTLGTASTTATGSYTMNENNTRSFITLVSFNSTGPYGGELEVDAAANHDSVEVRFGLNPQGVRYTQKAHRFLVPLGATSGVNDTSYHFKDYVDVPFQVWDLHTNQQLMVSFRDQGRDGAFNLIAQNTTDTTSAGKNQSREYLFIHNVPYSTSPNPNIQLSKGQTYQRMYFFWPVLTASATWNPNSLPTSSLQMLYSSVFKFSSTVKSVADVYGDYDKINEGLVHPDQHNIYPIKWNNVSQKFQLLMSNDGGVFLSDSSTSPGTLSGVWKKVGNGYNTSQFYGADKKPGAQEYFGGMQDNSTYYTPSGTVSAASTYFVTNSQLSGDGFEVLWHSLDPNKMIGGSQYNGFSKTINGGSTWAAATAGFPLSNGSVDQSKFPFISKLANSKQMPDVIFSAGSQGVWRSTNFGSSWSLVPITQGWGGLSSLVSVEVSRANANIVWAGNGQYSVANLFVSTDGGKTFSATQNPAGYTLGGSTKIATHPIDQNIAYALYSFANTAKILKTTDLGQTWNDISGFGTSGSSSSNGFPDVAVYSLYVRPDNPNIIWAGTEIGIVESLDGGSTWALLTGTGFPSVAVWDMKGQDNEIIIATHGRGIWTATLSIDQNANFAPAQVIAAGTAPQSNFKMKIHVPVAYDSIQITIGTKKVTFSPPDSGAYILEISNASKGNQSIQLISYKGTAPVYSALANGLNLTLKSTQTQFYDYLSTVDNFYLDGMQFKPFGNSNSSLQSDHNYISNQNISSTLLVPIIVSSGSNTSLAYSDVTIVQPGANGSVFGQAAFNDYVVVEATKDGLTWLPLAKGYNSSANGNWLATYNSKQTGDPTESVTETVNLKNKFNTGDTILVRFRMYSNNDNIIAWGWSVDDIFIQQTPTAVEPQAQDVVSVYPNPTNGKLNLNYSLTKDSEVAIVLWDMTGRSMMRQNFGTQSEGTHHTEINLEGLTDGIYLVKVRSNEIDKTIKVVVRK